MRAGKTGNKLEIEQIGAKDVSDGAETGCNSSVSTTRSHSMLLLVWLHCLVVEVV